MSTIRQIETAVATYLLAMFPGGERVIVQGNVGEGPAPASPSVLWRLDKYTLPDFTRTEHIDDDQIIRAVTPLEFVITCVGDRAGDDASVRDDALRLALGLRATQRTADLYVTCGLWGVGEVRDLSALETGKMRQRAEFRLTVSANLTFTTVREVIDEVDLVLPQFDKTVTVEGPT